MIMGKVIRKKFEKRILYFTKCSRFRMEPHFRKWPFRKNYLKNKKCLVLWMA